MVAAVAAFAAAVPGAVAVAVAAVAFHCCNDHFLQTCANLSGTAATAATTTATTTTATTTTAKTTTSLFWKCR